MSRTRTSRAILAGIALIAMLALGSGVAGADPDPTATSAGSKHSNGRYQGKVGTFARIVFNASSSRVKKLNAGVQASCQRASDGAITRIALVAMKTKKQLKIKKGERFKGKGQEDNGVAWEIKGRFKGKKKAVGSFEASMISFDPLTFDSELCAGSGKWKAKLKR